jgi:hypothetical protein
VPSNTSRIGRAVVWLAIVLILAGGVLDAIAGSWPGVVLAAVGIAVCSLLLVMGRTRAVR